MMKKLLILTLPWLLAGQLLAQQTVVNVHTTGGNVTECLLGESGVVLFTAEGEQIAVIENSGLVRGFGLGMVEKLTFAEQAEEPDGIEQTESHTLVAYPNPTVDFIGVYSENGSAKSLELFDIHGRRLHYSLFTNHYSLDLRAYPQGVYFLRANGQTLKIVKQ